MRIRADFAERVVVRPADYDWVGSPMPGVERMMLDRVGEEVARATSIVRYAPNSTFSEHVHGGGEEFLVLSGSFHDDPPRRRKRAALAPTVSSRPASKAPMMASNGVSISF